MCNTTLYVHYLLRHQGGPTYMRQKKANQDRVKKTGYGRPPRHLYFKNFYGSPDYKNTNLHYRKMFLTQNIIQDILNMFSFCLKKVEFF